VDYYDRRSSHGSTLSRVAHSWVLARSDRQRAIRYFAEALQSDVSDIRQATTTRVLETGATHMFRLRDQRSSNHRSIAAGRAEESA
jgi:trehalose/maltose hydrolase-like predicted phosphorylase